MRLLWRDREVGADAAGLQDALRTLGVGPGHRVAALAGNTPLHALLHQAARSEGWTLVPLPLGEPEAVAAARLGRLACDAAVLLDDASLAPAAGSRLAAGALGMPAVHADALGNVSRTEGHVTSPRQPQARLVIETSGTTGTPRAVAITEGMLAAHATSASDRIGDGPDAVWLATLGLHHVGGVALLDRALRHGSTVVLHERFDADAAAQALREHAVTHASLVPTMLARLLAAWGDAPAPPSLRCVLLGGDHAPEPLVRQALAAGWPVHVTYGLTEACSQVCTALPDEWAAHPGTSGRPLRGVQVDAVDGEVVVAGPTVAGGGPLATGDLGILVDGRLTVTGRKDDRIVTGGAKVDPAAVEAVLRTHPDVLDAAVVGLPDVAWGSRVVAAVVLRSTVPDLRTWCKARLAPHQVPKDVVAVSSLPRTEAGKLRRAAVRDLLSRTA